MTTNGRQSTTPHQKWKIPTFYRKYHRPVTDVDELTTSAILTVSMYSKVTRNNYILMAHDWYDRIIFSILKLNLEEMSIDFFVINEMVYNEPQVS